MKIMLKINDNYDDSDEIDQKTDKRASNEQKIIFSGYKSKTRRSKEKAQTIFHY